MLAKAIFNKKTNNRWANYHIYSTLRSSINEHAPFSTIVKRTSEDCLVHVPYLSVYIAKRRRISTFVVLYESRTSP